MVEQTKLARAIMQRTSIYNAAYALALSRALTRSAGPIVAAVGAVVLLGWWFDVPGVTRVIPGSISMKANTAFSFVIVGCVLVLLAWRAEDRGTRPLALGASALLWVIGVLTFVECVTSLDFNIDNLLTQESSGSTLTPHPGRMSPMTAVNFVLIAMAGILVEIRAGRWRARAWTWLLTLGLLDSVIATVSYIFEIAGPYGFGGQNPMALNTAILFVLAFGGMLCLRPSEGWLALLTSDTSGGLILRRIAPAIVFFPLLIGWLGLQGERNGLYDTQFGVALAATLAMVGIGAVTLLGARHLNRIDAERERHARQAKAEERERKRVEEQLRQAQKMVKLGHYRWDKSQRRLLSCSDVYLEILGIPPGLTSEVEGGLIPYVHPDDRERVLEAHEAAEAEGRGVHLEFRIVRSDGVVRYLRDLNEVEPTAGGNSQIWFGTVQDVSDLKRGEMALRESEERFRNFIDHSPIAVTLKDLRGKYLLVNQRFTEWFGLASRKISELTVGDLLSADEAMAIAAQDNEVLRLLRPVVRELEVHFSDRRSHKISRTAFPVLDHSGSPIAIGAATMDVTEQRAAEEQLRQAQKMEAVGQLTGGIAHDFNNLLGIVIGNLDIALEDIDGDSKASMPIERALKGALQGAKLTRRLLAFARKQPLDPKAFSVDEMISEVIPLLRRTLGEHISVQMATVEHLWPAYADPAQVQDALVNLAINARDAMPKGGVLTVETANATLDEHYAQRNPEVKPGDYVMLAVTDTGTGIPTEIMDRVLEPFFTTKPVGKGTGLGLAMIYGFAKQSGGHLKIYSEVGHGTTVKLYLPRAGTAAESGDVALHRLAELSGGGETILVAEDNEALRQTVVHQLKSLGYRVIEVENGEAALAVLRGSDPVDLLFTDMVMTGRLNGRELALEARRLRPGIVALLTTGYAERAVASGGDIMHVLAKPYRKQDLALKVRGILDRR